MVIGLIGGLLGRMSHIKLYEKIWSRHILIGWLRLIVGLIFALIGGLMLGLIGGLFFGLSENLIGWLIFTLIVGLIVGLIFTLIVGIDDFEQEVKSKNIPNEGILLSLRSGLIYGLLGGLIYGLVAGLLSGLLSAINDAMPYIMSDGLIRRNERSDERSEVLTVGLTVGLIGGLNSGWGTVIKHTSLRLVLYRRSYAPWNYARFLEHVAKHRFIQRVGGRYRFVHDLLRKHFASMYEPR